ncbi:MAG: ABC transporter substrate-binding protein [Deltaproteobacteria bacterium]|nr:ABC transporter substrate-binding protein [Deltaproteobacteria bacterium]
MNRASLSLGLLLFTISCGPKVPTPILKRSDGTTVQNVPKPNQDDENLAAALANDAKIQTQKGHTEAAAAKEQQIIESYPATLAAAQLYLQRAVAFEKSGELNAAISNYEKLLFFRPSFADANAIRESYANLLISAGRYNDAANMLLALYDQGNNNDKLRIALPLTDALVGAHRSGDALIVLAQVQSLKEAQTKALEIINTSLPLKDAVFVWDRLNGSLHWSAIEPALAYKLAKIYYHVRDFKRSESMLKLVATRYPSSQFAAPAREFAARLQSRFVVHPQTIGIILPLSGKFEQYGQRSLAAIKVGLGKDSSVQLVIKDTKGEAQIAAQAVEDLVLADHVIAIIGPLFANEALAAAQKAEELSVPLITLSFRDGLPQIGPYIFCTALTIETQAKELARVAFEEMGFSRFAILFPRNSYGREFIRLFWDEVDKRKGEIRAVETYDNDQTTFTEPAKRLVGRWNVSARADFREALAALRAKKLPAHRMHSAIENLQKRLTPIIDFDAIIIPDSGRKISLIAPALAVEDVVTTRDPKELEKIKKATGNPKVSPVTLLGGSTWNHQQTVAGCERYCEGAVFVDGFFADSTKPKVRNFVAEFQEASGAAPQLSDAQAFDTFNLLHKIIIEAKPTDRIELRDALTRMVNYEGITGSLRFNADGEVNKKLFVLTISDGLIRQWEKAPLPPQG